MAPESTLEARELSLSAARVEAWSQCVGPFSIYGYSIGLCLSVSASGGDDVTLTITLTLNGTNYNWQESFSGNISYNLPIVSGLSLGIAVSNWNIQGQSVCFTLTVKVYVFGFPVTLYSGTVCIPLSTPQDIAALTAIPVNSPRDLADLLGLLGQIQQPTALEEGAPMVAKKCWSGRDCTGKVIAYRADCHNCKVNSSGKSLGEPGTCQNC